jgi:hypothetical protein
METPEEYMKHTKSAVEHLIRGIDSYHQILLSTPEQGITKNTIDLQKVISPIREFSAQKYALANLCGSLLQIASMAITLYSTNNQVLPELSSVVKGRNVKFCIGRLVRDIPLGLVILAGRNQYNHIDDDKLREPNLTVFKFLATRHGNRCNYIDPGFDLNTRLVWNYASNIIKLIGWQDYKTYDNDMRCLLGI